MYRASLVPTENLFLASAPAAGPQGPSGGSERPPASPPVLAAPGAWERSSPPPAALPLRMPGWFLIQHPLKDLVCPVQLRHRQDHIDDLPMAVPVMDGGVQQLLPFCQLLKLMILFQGHGKLPQIACLPQHLSQIDLTGNPLIGFGQGQAEGQHIFQGRAR